MKKRVLALVLALVLCISLLPTMALATEGGNVCKIGDTEYETLIAAVKAATDGQTVELLSDTTVTGKMNELSSGGDITFYLTKSVVLDLKGHSVTMPEAMVGVWGTGSNTLTITDSSEGGSGKFTFGSNTYNIITDGYANVKTALVVSGGYFSIDVSANCAPGYKVVAGEGDYVGMSHVVAITEAEAAAKIVRDDATIYYETLAKAMTAAQPGEQIVLTNDNSESVTLKLGVTLNENGKSYTGTVTKANSTAIASVQKNDGVWVNVPVSAEGAEASVTVSDETYYYAKLKDAMREHNKRGVTIKLLKDIEIAEADLVTESDSWLKVSCDYMFDGTFYATLDGSYVEDEVTKNHSITYTGKKDALAFRRMDGKLSHVTFKGMNDAISFISGYAYVPVYEYVDVYGRMTVTGNNGAYAVYASMGQTFDHCTNYAVMTGMGFPTDYNAVFVGYVICAQNDVFTFTNCVNAGSLVCGKAAMFVGNPAGPMFKMDVSNCENTGRLVSTYVDNSYNMNYYMAVDSNTPKIILNSKEIEAKTTKFTNASQDTGNGVTNSGTLFNGPINTGMQLDKYVDGTYKLTPATNGKIEDITVAHYEVGSGLYTSVDGGGSSRYYAIEEVPVASFRNGYYKSVLKDLRFVDKTFVGGGATSELAGNKTFTKENTTYYVIPDGYSTNESHTAANAEYHYIAAYDADGNLLGSVTSLGETPLQVPVAAIGTKEFTSLADAVAAVPTDGTKTKVVLLKDITAESEGDYVTIDGGRYVDLDMNGHTIAISSYNCGPFAIAGGRLELSGTGTVENTCEEGFYVVELYSAPTAQANYSVFTQGENVTLTGNWAVVNIQAIDADNNASNYGAVVNLNGTCNTDDTDDYVVYVSGNVHNTENAAIINFGSTSKIEAGNYIAGYAVVNVADGAEFTSEENCISIAAGELNISGGTFTGGDNVEIVGGSGGSIDFETCCAVLVHQHSTNLPITVNITDGTFKSAFPFWQATGEKGESARPDIVTLHISGGKFFSTYSGLDDKASVKSANKTGFLKGGYFNSEVANTYVASAYECVALDETADADAIAAGYTHKVTLITTKPTPTSGPVITVEYDDKQQQTEYHSDAEAAVESAKESTAKATVTVESGTEHTVFTTTIDDTVTIVVEDTTKVTATVSAEPGYEVFSQIEDHTATITAEPLEIGQKSELDSGDEGSGTTETKQTATQNVAADVAVSTAVSNIAGNVTEKTATAATAEIVTAAKDAAKDIHQGMAAKALNNAGIAVTNEGDSESGVAAAKNVSVFVDTYYETKVTADKTGETKKSFALDITPMYQAYATTQTIDENTTLSALTNENSAPIGKPQKLDLTDKSVTMRVKLPAGFVESENDKVYVKHTTAPRVYYYYTATVEAGTGADEGSFFAVFTNPHGFSEFEFSRESQAPVPSGGSATTYTVTGADTVNGKLTVSTKSAAAGSSVTVTATPDEGYTLSALTVLDKDGKEVEVKNVGDGKYRFTMPTSDVTVSATFEKGGVCPKNAICPIAMFIDAKPTEWYHDGVHFCLENGYMNGVGNDQFAPNGTLSRAMIVTMLWRLEGKPVVNYAMSFKDVKADQWYTEAIRWAQSTGVVEGYNADSFGPDDDVTREQLATILYRYAKYKDIDTDSFTKDTNTLSYTDVFTISDWANAGMHFCIAAGVVSGNGDMLYPTNTATRAEAATMFQRFCEKVLSK